MFETLEEMRTKGLDRMRVDYSEVMITDEDRRFDYVEILVDVLPKIRNDYAHGSGSIHRGVYTTLELTMEIINQVYPVPA